MNELTVTIEESDNKLRPTFFVYMRDVGDGGIPYLAGSSLNPQPPDTGWTRLRIPGELEVEAAKIAEKERSAKEQLNQKIINELKSLCNKFDNRMIELKDLEELKLILKQGKP